MDLTLVQRESHTPVGGCLQLFTKNWKQVSQDPWIQETITGCKIRICHQSTTGASPPYVSSGQTKVLSYESGTTEVGSQAGHRTGERPYRCVFCQPNVPCGQVRWFLETSDKSEGSEFTCCFQALQDGIHSNGEGSLVRGGLHGEVRPERRLSVCFSLLSTQEVYSLPLGGSSMEVQNPAIRPEQCSKPIVAVLRKLGIRHVDNGILPGEGTETPLCSPGTVGSPGFCGQHEEKCDGANSINGVLGVHSRLQPDENFSTYGEIEINPEASQGDSPTDTLYCETTCLAVGNDGGGTPGNFACTTPLPTLRESEVTVSAPAQELRETPTDVSGNSERVGLVDKMCYPTQWQVSPDYPVGPHHRDGRIYNKIGCLLQESDNGTSLDGGRIILSYQLFRASGSCTSLSKGQTESY